MHIWVALRTIFHLVYNKFTFADVSNLSDDVIKKALLFSSTLSRVPRLWTVNCDILHYFQHM